MGPLQLYRRRLEDSITEDFIHAAGSGDVNTLLNLISKGVNINANGSSGTSALWIAAWWGHTEVVKILIQAGANVNITDESGGRTPLMAAAHMVGAEECGVSFADANYISVMQCLIDSGAYIEATDNEGHTPLITAVNAGSINAVRLLIQHGANLDAKDNQQKTALWYAENGGILFDSDKINYPQIVTLLRKSGGKIQ